MTEGNDIDITFSAGVSAFASGALLVIPNLLHYVYLNKGDLPFFVLVNIQTAVAKLNPETVYVYTLHKPEGESWKMLIRSGNVIVEVVKTPVEIWGRVPEPTDFAHMSDIIRMKALTSRGGIYLDTDMVIFASFDRFRSEPFTIGFCKEFDNARVFSNSIILAQNSSVFLKLWYDSYKTVNFKCWDWYVVFSYTRFLPLDLHLFLAIAVEFRIGLQERRILKPCHSWHLIDTKIPLLIATTKVFSGIAAVRHHCTHNWMLLRESTLPSTSGTHTLKLDGAQLKSTPSSSVGMAPCTRGWCVMLSTGPLGWLIYVTVNKYCVVIRCILLLIK